MKKTLVLIFTGLLPVLLSFCSHRDTEKEKTAAQADGTHAETPSPTLSDTVKTDSIKVTFIELGSVNCIPCKMMQPVMEAIGKEYGDQVSVVFHDVWTEKGRPYAEKYGIRSIPTQIFLDSSGEEYFRHTGYFPKEALVDVLKQKGVN